MAKKKKGKVIQMLSPEKYIKQKARTLPIHECLINNDWQDAGLANICISRKHSNGHFTIGNYLIDLKCLGVKDTQGFFNISPSEYNELKERMNETFGLETIEYVLAHNIIFSGWEYADELGFKPHPDFSLTKYILEEDNDNVELMDIECGQNGKPFYAKGPLDSDVKAAQILNHLEKTLGAGNYEFIDTLNGLDEFDEDEFDLDFDDDDLDDFEFSDDDYSFEEMFYTDEEKENSGTFQFKIQIKNIKSPPVWRKLIVPSYFSFADFHMAIQIAFGWMDMHLWSFSPQGQGITPQIQLPDTDEESSPSSNALLVRLGQIFSEEGQKYNYTYDFGDDWVHEITLEKIIPEQCKTISCPEGKGQCPPEDCGGPFGYERLKTIMANPTHPDYKELSEWLFWDESNNWDPKEFDIESCNEELDAILE